MGQDSVTGKTGRTGRRGGSSVLSLLHLCDSLFPIGAFGHSDGLEAATASGRVATADGLYEWMDLCLDESIGRLDGPAVLLAWSAFRNRDWAALERVDREGTALRPSSSARHASRAMGLRLVITWQKLYPNASLAELIALAEKGTLGPTLPVAFGSASAASGVDRRLAVEAFAYSRLAAVISSAMRLMPIGQIEAHTLLAREVGRIPAVVDAIESRGAVLESFAPALELAAMTQQYLHSRLFRS